MTRCDSCGAESTQCYRCSECGADLVGQAGSAEEVLADE
jgi:DNA-directed RNA polymerase subunit RPC12/RpoP